MLTPAAPATSIPKVLIVNDDVHSAVAFKSVLSQGVERKEYEVVLAYSGEAALRHLLKEEFAVVLLDIKMPIMDGFETAEAIHSNLRLSTLPIIFVTAYYDDDFHRLLGYQKGAVDYVFMPVNAKILQTKVSVFVELARQKMSLKRQNQELHSIADNLKIKRLTDRVSGNDGLETDETSYFLNQISKNVHDASTRDTLTGLLNLQMLTEHLEHAASVASRYQQHFALVVLRIDQLEHVNATFGEKTKDALLMSVADQIKLSVRISDLPARIGEDSFALLLKGLAGMNEAVHVSGKLAQAIDRTYELDGHSIEIKVSIGIAMYPQDGSSPQQLIETAASAMFPVKQLEIT
ncbi:diguanylate cyclase [Oxalobacteraceae bacterium R-40]|uniref:Diguanylate cyclase n=1 Tax=Keguizhuia sedimenti TaxID=3064264 RepID=A0ABU1BVG8_9BURK|nr:diguanylate cyclase [Oxalobacteraceae bacterium R-40]MDQ9172084.1 diguanylate cyclase [Oxalobacteraceae bacterium R-40]